MVAHSGGPVFSFAPFAPYTFRVLSDDENEKETHEKKKNEQKKNTHRHDQKQSNTTNY